MNGVLFPAVTGKRIYLFAMAPRPAPLSNAYGEEAVSRSYSGRGLILTIYLHLLSRLRLRGAVIPLAHTASWRGIYLNTGSTFSLH